MFGSKLCMTLAVFGVMGVSSAVNAAVVMDAGTHNGGLEGGTFGNYWNNAGTNAPEWTKTGSHVYNGALFIQAYPATDIFNNTGELVVANHEYTLSADLGDRELTTIDVYVRATEFADGSGAFVDLAQVTRTGTDPGSFTLYTATDTGSAASAGIAGYFIQVLVQTDGAGSGQNYFFDNINVSSELAIPEPASLGLLVPAALALSRRRRAC